MLRPSPVPSRLVRAAGAVVWRFVDRQRVARPGEVIDPRDIEVLMVHRPKYKDWSWPKGKAELNEPITSAAVREVEEETGLPVILGAPLTTQRYRLGSGQTKEVLYWVGTLMPEDPSDSGGAPRRTRVPVHRAPSSEIDTNRWASPRKAESLLTRRGDRRLLSELLSRAQDGTLVTSTLMLARHAKAESRQSWLGDEASRPLSRLGVRQAFDLVDILSAFGIEKAYSSPWQRCAQTLAPWAGVAGLSVTEVPALTEWAVDSRPDDARDFIASMLTAHHVPSVICVHRPTIPVCLAPLIDAAPASIHAHFPRSSPWLRTAQVLVVHVALTQGEPRVLAVERHGTRTKDVLGF
ncbi:histidine phosphatase family protein [Schaalia sp. ZJ405]|uniref:NUDIX hydrolase n=1 Tax=unclassified Schaalia TaxID=2691889 RepID=UPI0013EC7C07|nr:MULTISPECIES: histidine phosphatase family protein [unclassified Schaalia]QPK81097.1 histidine phosphatase family protein [Schaalia sp. ZJ405]